MGNSKLATGTVEHQIRTLLAKITLNEKFLSGSVRRNTYRLGLDSTGMIELVCALEQEFAISILEDDMVPENFQSIRALTQMVESKNASF